MGDGAEQRPVVIGERAPIVLAAEHGELEAQDDGLDVFGAPGPRGEAGQRREEAVQDAIHAPQDRRYRLVNGHVRVAGTHTHARIPEPTGCLLYIRTYNRHMPNKTISVPDDVIPVIESLDVPFSRWVTDQLRLHAAKSTMSFADQLLADAVLAEGERLPDRDEVGERMARTAPW